MLRKLMKYEFKAMGRILLPLYGAVIVMGLITSMLTKFEPFEFMRSFTAVRIIGILCVVLYGGLIAASLGLSYIISILRFKKNTLEAEGYLINTLPVATWENITGKLIVSMVFQILGVIAAAISGIIFIFIMTGIKAMNLDQFFTELSIIMKQYGGSVVLYTIEGIIFGLFTLAGSNLMFFASLSVGHSFNSRKVLKSVGAFIGFYIASQIISMNFLNLFFSNTDISIIDQNIMSLQPFIISLIVLQIFYCVAYFAVTRYFLKNKLNLQ